MHTHNINNACSKLSKAIKCNLIVISIMYHVLIFFCVSVAYTVLSVRYIQGWTIPKLQRPQWMGSLRNLKKNTNYAINQNDHVVRFSAKIMKNITLIIAICINKMYVISFIHSFIPDIYIAPLQVLYYSEALPTTARILYQSFTPKRTGNCR